MLLSTWILYNDQYLFKYVKVEPRESVIITGLRFGISVVDQMACFPASAWSPAQAKSAAISSPNVSTCDREILSCYAVSEKCAF